MMILGTWYVCYYQLLPNLTNSTLINIQTFVNSEFKYFFLFTSVNICQSYVPINNAVSPPKMLETMMIHCTLLLSLSNLANVKNNIAVCQ